MCGLAGIYNKDNSLEIQKDALMTMSLTMKSRGPDDSGEWISKDSRIGFCHRRLSILDLSEKGHQPMVLNDGPYALIYNGEIYNFKDLRKELSSLGYQFYSESDTEVILKGLIHFGIDFVKKLRGMFSIAFWDGKKECLYLIRDPFGIKPLYYYESDGQVFFASTIKALKTQAVNDLKKNDVAKLSLLIWGHVQEPLTIYEGIYAVSSGSYLEFTPHGKKEVCFHSLLEMYTSLPAETFSSQKEAYQKLYEALKESVAYHLVSDVQVGLFLSGGLDSCNLLAIAHDILNQNLQSHTLHFSEFENTAQDELSFAQTVAKKYGARHYSHTLSKREFFDSLPHLMESMDQPSIDGVNTYFISKKCHEAGLKVALSGLGGDEIFGGYNNFDRIPKIVNSLNWLRHLHGGPKMARKAMSALGIAPKYASLFEYGTNIQNAYLLNRALFMPWEVEKLFGKSFLETNLEKLPYFQKVGEKLEQMEKDFFAISFLETNYYMKNQLLKDSDWAGMAFSLEIRVPFVDKELFSKVISLVKGGLRLQKKEINIQNDISLPTDIVQKPKTGFGIPVDRWIQEESSQKSLGGLKDWCLYLDENWK